MRRHFSRHLDIRGDSDELLLFALQALWREHTAARAAQVSRDKVASGNELVADVLRRLWAVCGCGAWLTSTRRWKCRLRSFRAGEGGSRMMKRARCDVVPSAS